MRRALLALLPAALLGACMASGPVAVGRGEARTAPPSPPPAEPTRPPPSTTDALLEQSRLERSGGRYEASAASLERALRIAPTDPRLWLELAELRLLQNDDAQARILAQRALALAGGDANVERRARAVLVAAD